MCLIKAIKTHNKRKKVLKLDDVDLDKAVKIQGTEFDRKRRFSDEQVQKMKDLLGEGTSAKDVAKYFRCSVHTMLYNTSEEYRRAAIEKRSGKHTGVTHMDFDNRVAYKRNLVKTKKIDIAKVVL